MIMLRSSGLLGLAFVISACGSSGADDPSSPSPGDPGASTAPPPGATADSGPTPTGTTASRCKATAAEITCSSHQLSLLAQLVPRDVFYELPLGTPPAKGWPVALFFQGSFVPAAGTFVAKKDDLFGLFNMTLTVKELLDHGYAVLAPNAAVAGRTAWETNVPPWSEMWSKSSSGGYATCGLTCTLPKPLPSDHPPTLFLHGGADTTVAPSTMEMYRDELVAEGRVVKTLLDPKAGHEWLPAGPAVIRAWFDASP